MYITKPTAEIIYDNEISPYKKIEAIGRTCYKSEFNITETSYEPFIKGIVKSKHESVIEHHVFVLEISGEMHKQLKMLNPKFINLSVHNKPDGKRVYLTSGSARGFKDLYKRSKNVFPRIVIAYLSKDYGILFSDDNYGTLESVQGGYVKNLLTFDEVNSLPTVIRKLHQTISVRFTVDRGISHELVRHRLASFSQESTRYCNYSQGRHGYNITLIDPFFYEKGLKRFVWKFSCKVSEFCYMLLTKKLGSTAQEARSVLPNSLKTELVMTLNILGWENFFGLREDNAVHPQCREVVLPLKKEFIKKKYI